MRQLAIATLVLLNGLPGIGKSTLAREVVAIEPSITVVEVDDFRVGRSDFATDVAKIEARSAALDAIDALLASGQDVIVPQYLGRPDFVESMAEVAERRDARFVHAIVVGSSAIAIARFRQRRFQLAGSDRTHPEAEVPDDEIDEVIRTAAARLRELSERGAIREVESVPALAGLFD